MAISPKQAKKLLDKNVKNIEVAVQNGKVLTSVQIAALQAVAAQQSTIEKKVASNQVELAQIFGVNRKTVQRWLKIEGNPGAESNGTYNVIIWREWCHVNGHKFDDDDGLDKSSLQARNILLQNERLQLANEEKRGKLIPREMAKQIFTQLVFAAKSRCFTGIPRVVTLARMAKDTTEACEEIRKEFEDIWSQLNKGDWYQPQKDTNEPPKNN